jgi:sensor histidine kinase YesM
MWVANRWSAEGSSSLIFDSRITLTDAMANQQIQDPQSTFKPIRLIAAIWTAVAGVNVFLSLMGPHPGVDTPGILGTCVCGFGFAVLLFSATERVRQFKRRLVWPVLCCIVVLCGFTVWALDASLQFWAGHRWILQLPPFSVFVLVRYNFVYFTLIFALQTAAYAFLASKANLAARDKQLAQSRIAEQQARLTALALQLNPHFLFNALNALRTLVGEGRKHEAEEVLSRLSSFLRSSLSFEPGELITLDSELETVQAYLDIESTRFGDRLQVTYQCEPDLQDALVPPLILQPLVENAVRYAVAPSLSQVQIAIHAKLANSQLTLSVVDNGATVSTSGINQGGGIGLANVAARLEALYGAEARLSTQKRQPGFAATVSLPLRTPERNVP